MEKKFWEEKYAKGGISGGGSIGKNRTWKWEVINEFFPKLDYVVDIGCGDLSFWGNRTCKHYVGIDISPTIIKRNRKKRPSGKFICTNAVNKINGIEGQAVLCLDMLFHIMNEKDFIKILHNLCHYSKKWIFIYTWSKNPFEQKDNPKYKKGYVTNGKSTYFRPLKKWFGIFTDHGFDLIATRSRKGDWRVRVEELYVFHKHVHSQVASSLS